MAANHPVVSKARENTLDYDAGETSKEKHSKLTTGQAISKKGQSVGYAISVRSAPRFEPRTLLSF